MPATARFRRPRLAAAQARKEVTHQEARTLLDALVQPVVEAGPQNSPPLAPAVGQCWLVGPAPTAEWSEAAGTIALWTAGGLRFAAPFAGMRLLRLSDHAWLRCAESGWSRPAAAASPSGRAVVASQAHERIAPHHVPFPPPCVVIGAPPPIYAFQ